jgi:hypothetical protein
MDPDLEELTALGKILDTSCDLLDGRTAGVYLAQVLLQIRARTGKCVPCVLTWCRRSLSGVEGSGILC